MTSRILIIDPNDRPRLRAALEQEHRLAVQTLPQSQATAETVAGLQPDLIVLDAGVKKPGADELLTAWRNRQIDAPVVLVDANGQMGDNFDHPNIAGRLGPSFTAAELAQLIQSVLDQPRPAQELVLTKRAELVESNQRLAHRVQELQTLFQIGKTVTGQLELPAVLRQVVKAAVKLTNADESYLLLVDETSDDLYLRAEANLEAETAQNFRVKVTDSLAGQVVQSGQPIRISRAKSELKVKTGLTVYALLNVPLKLGGSVMGVLGVDNRHRRRAFTADDQKLLSNLAGWAAIAIQNARLYSATDQLSRDLKLAHQISRLVAGTLDIEQIPRLLLQRTAEITEAECGSLGLIDPAKNGVVIELAYDQSGQELKTLKDFLIPFDEGIMGLVAQTGQPIIANQVGQHPAWSAMVDQLTGFTTKKLIAAPLLAEGETLGVIELLNKKEGDFGENDLLILELVAAWAAIAIQNARQYAALRRSNQALKMLQEQRIAAENWTVLGKAAANLAHRINNSTALVPMAAQHLRELLQQIDIPTELAPQIEGNLGRIERNSLYTVELAAALLRRFRKDPTEKHNVNALVEQALALADLPDNIKLVRHLDPDLPPVDTSDLLGEVLLELISNAGKALGQQHDGLLRVATFEAGLDKVSIQVTDNGPGIPPDKLERVFDIFYSSSASSLGFGLWWVKTFLEQQGGEISVESAPYQNTTFTITLPRHLP